MKVTYLHLNNLLRIVAAERNNMDHVETMAYSTEEGKPWHGLGTGFTGSVSIEEMLKLAQLDWTVSRRLVRMKECRDCDNEIVIPGYHAIVRDSDNTVYQVASDQYKPILNRTILNFFKDWVEAGGMTLDTAGSLKHGAIVWAQAKINQDFILPGNDRVEGRLLLASSHDGSLQFTGMTNSTRTVCWNTLQLSFGEKMQRTNGGGWKVNKDAKGIFRMKHSKAFTGSVEKDAKAKLGFAVGQMQQFQQVAERLVEAKVDPHGQLIREYILRLTNPDLLAKIVEANDAASKVPVGGSLLDAIVAEHSVMEHKYISHDDLGRVGKAILDDIIDSPGSKLSSAQGTWWGALNGVTRWVDHDAGRERDTALASAWFGVRGQTKQDALELAIQYAEANMQ